MKQIITILFLVISLSVFAQDRGYLPKLPTAIHQNGKFGLADPNGKIIFKPIFDSILVFKFYSYPFILFKNNGKYGIGIKPTDKEWIFSKIEYDKVEFKYDGIYILRKGNKYGMISFKFYTKSYRPYYDIPSYINKLWDVNFSKINYDSIYYDSENQYVLRENKKYGVLFNTNKSTAYLYPNYDTIPILFTSVAHSVNDTNLIFSCFYVKKNKKTGVVFVNEKLNKQILPFIYSLDELKYFSEYEDISYKDEDGYERTKTIKNSYILIVPKENKPIQVFNIEDSTYTFLKDEKGEFIYRGDFSKFFFYASKKDYYIKNKKTNIYDSIVGFYSFELYNVEGNSIYNEKKKVFFSLNSAKSYVLESKNGIYNTSFDENINGLKHFYFKVNYKSNKEIEVIYYSYFENKKICSLLLKDIYGDDDIYINKISDDYVNLTIGKNENLIGKIKIKTLKFTPAKKWYGCKKKKGEGWELTYPEY